MGKKYDTVCGSMDLRIHLGDAHPREKFCCEPAGYANATVIYVGSQNPCPGQQSTGASDDGGDSNSHERL
jgi:hypothetical protein